MRNNDLLRFSKFSGIVDGAASGISQSHRSSTEHTSETGPNVSLIEEQTPTTSGITPPVVLRRGLKRKPEEEVTSSQFYKELLEIERERNVIQRERMENEKKYYEEKIRILRGRVLGDIPDAMLSAANDM